MLATHIRFHSMRRFSYLFCALAVVSAQAQSGSFSWQFLQDVTTSLPECSAVPIGVNSTGVDSGAYYMIALAANGTPTTSLVGTSVDNLAWVVNQPAGTAILFYLVDSKGNSGNIPARLYTVTAGQSSACLPPNATSSFTISANATEEIATCDFWELVMRGGKQPFNLLIAAPGALAPTNVTLSKGQDLYRYVNRAAPNGALLAAVGDSNGVWATGTPYVRTHGASNTTCPSRLSSGGVTPSTTTNSTDSENPHTSTGANKTPIIVGVCVPVVTLALLGLALFFTLLRRKRKQSAKNEYLEPRQFRETGNMMNTTDGSATSIFQSKPTRPSKFAHRADSSSAVVLIKNTSTSPAPITATSDPRSSHEPRSTPSTSSAAATIIPPARSPNSKMREGAGVAAVPTAIELPVPPASSTEDSRWPWGAELPSASIGPGEVVFQQTDARGVTIRELPPPYGTQLSASAGHGPT